MTSVERQGFFTDAVSEFREKMVGKPNKPKGAWANTPNGIALIERVNSLGTDPAFRESSSSFNLAGEQEALAIAWEFGLCYSTVECERCRLGFGMEDRLYCADCVLEESHDATMEYLAGDDW